MHILVSRVGDNNAVVISQNTLKKLTGIGSRNTIIKALKALEADNWIETRRIGERGTVNAYIINDRVAWTGKRDNIRYSLFSATVIVSEEEQPDRDQLTEQEPLRRLPQVGELQIPSGDGLPPPSQPSIEGLEPDLPATISQKSEVL